MRILCSLALSAIVAATGCDKLRSSLGRGGDGGEGGAVAAGNVSGNALPFSSGFEGEVGVVAKGKHASHAADGTQAMTLEVKGDKVRLDLPPGMAGSSSASAPGYVILNTPEKKLYMVMDAQKQAIIIDMNKAGDQLKAMAPPHAQKPGAPSGPPPKVTKTGKMETVAGFSCENWEIEQDGSKSVACIAQQGASWFHLPITGIPTEHAWMAELMDGKHFPLRLVSYTKGTTTEEARIEVTRIEKKVLAPARFEVPAGYKIVDLAQMMQGMGAPGRR